MPNDTQPNNYTGAPRRGTAQGGRPSPARSPQARRPRPQGAAAGSPEQRNRAAGAPGREPPRRPKKKIKYRWFTAVFMVLVTIGGCFYLSLYVLDIMQDLFGLNQLDVDVEVTIPQGATNMQIAQILAEKGVISDAFMFNLYVGLKVEEGGFLPGDYIFNKNMGYDQLSTAMQYRKEEKKVVTITFIEGRTLQEIAEQLEENKVCDADKFMEYLQSGEPDYEFVDRLPDGDLRFRRMEGYVFPDTYDFYVGEKVESVAAKFLSNFQRKMTDSLENRMMDLNLTMDETVTLASIIQKEAGNYSEMRRVSSVFHNRLRDSETYPQLQSDVTIFYVENFIKPQLDVVNQPMYDAYNTYVCRGLPEGAICNPGLDAIEAALNPEDTEYYFFVTDVNGKYYYAKTLEEHNANVRTALAQKDESGEGGEAHGTGVQGNK